MPDDKTSVTNNSFFQAKKSLNILFTSIILKILSSSLNTFNYSLDPPPLWTTNRFPSSWSPFQTMFRIIQNVLFSPNSSIVYNNFFKNQHLQLILESTFSLGNKQISFQLVPVLDNVQISYFHPHSSRLNTIVIFLFQ